MKMIYQIKHTRQNFFGSKFIKILGALLLIALIFFLISIFAPTRRLVVNIFSPFLEMGNGFYATFENMPSFFSDKIKLIEENDILLAELQDSYLLKANYESIEYENRKLREELMLRPEGDFKTAVVIAKPPQIPLDSLFLNIGISDGVGNDDMVLAADRVLIGKIVKTSIDKSTVALNSFAGSNLFGFIARTNEPLEIKGTGGGNMEAKVPIDFDVVLGDKIMINHSAIYLAGVVGLVEEDKLSGFKNIILSLPVNVSEIRVVFIKPTSSE